jgi:putative aminopeptidase FrvX
MNPYEQLMEMLTYRRPAGSKAERKFINRFIRPLGVKQDEAGNLIKRIGDAPVMWSSHTDTVHRSSGRQLLMEKDGIVTAPNSTCLGADDTAGVWLMVQMIRRNVPGLYVFHRAEECGGYGSLHIAKANRALLDGIDYAIALDRKGEQSIVTHQWGGRCCSDEFARALAKALGLGMKPDDGGTFTDTANYMEHVPECTNISVGYYLQHSSSEWLNVAYLFKLLDALVALDTTSLPVMRDHTATNESGDWSWAFKDTETTTDDRFAGMSNYEALRDVVRHHPEAVADFLDQYGITAHEILEDDRYRCTERG